MNNKNRKTIEEWLKQIETIKSGVSNMAHEEQDKYDNLPEGLQDSEKGDSLQGVVDYLSDAEDCLEDAIENLKSAKE